MPSSPALRFSSSSELRGENHKRGRSFGSGVFLKEKDDDLALFNEMESKESDDFLLQLSDDFEDTFSSKLKHFSDPKFGISVPVRGDWSELLNLDGDKNDYDWLLTPPETPLFPSLDDEPPPITAASKGRPRSLPISISRSFTMEKNNQGSRGGASPNRLSPSPWSAISTLQSRGGPSSATISCPKPSLRPATPTRRPSPPPHKPLTSVPRSSTRTSRRISTGSNAFGSSGVIRVGRGNSASPEIRAWQSNIPGLVDTPPNLRTSLADRPALYVRGSSPASRSSRDSAARPRRQSTSPTCSRSVSSSHSYDRDKFSCQSKGSVASSMDDDLDSLQSDPMGGSECSFSKRVGSLPSDRSLAFSKKPSRIVSPGSAPDRPFDTAISQMDHRRNPRNMFRPLLSSAPSATFYMRKSSSHHPVFSRNSSMETSSYTSSKQFTSFSSDAELCDQHLDDLAEREKESNPGAKDCSPSFSQNSMLHVIDAEAISNSDVLHARGDSSGFGNLENVEICPVCGHPYCAMEHVDIVNNLCPECREQHDLATITVHNTTTIVAHAPSKPSEKISENYKSFDKMNPPDPLSELVLRGANQLEPVVAQDDESCKQGQTSHGQMQSHLLEASEVMALVDEGEERLNFRHEIDPHNVSRRLQAMDPGPQQLQLSDEPYLHVDSSEGVGISMLFKRLNNIKGPVVQGRTFIASPFPKPYKNLSYSRDRASSSFDYDSTRRTETYVQQQFSGKKYVVVSDRSDFTSNAPNSTSSLPRVSNHEHLALGIAPVAPEENLNVSITKTILWETEEKDLVSHLSLLKNKAADVITSSFTGMEAFEGRTSSIDPSTSELSSSTASIQLKDNSVSSVLNCEISMLHEDKKAAQGFVSDIETPHIILESPLEEHSMLNNNLQVVDVVEVGRCSLSSISETEIENACQEAYDSQTHDKFSKLKSNRNGLQELPSPESVDQDVAAAVPKSNSLDHSHETLDDPTAMMESHRESRAKSLSLAEATDAILFCSSIVHGIAYKAASIAIEKETKEPAEEVSRPTVTVLGKSCTDRGHGRTIPNRKSKMVKTEQRQLEKNEKSHPNKTLNDENADEPMARNVGISDKGDGMKSPKLESKCNCSIM